MEILIGTNPPVKHKVYWKGSVYALDSMPTVSVSQVIEDPTGEYQTATTFLTVLTAEQVETDIGVYQIFIPFQYVNTTKQLQIQWEYTIEGTHVVKKDDIFVIQPYADITQIGSDLELGSDPSDPNYKSFEELQQAEKYARRVIEAYTGQRFYKYYDSHTQFGDGTDVLPMPYRMVEFKELYMNDTNVISVDLNKYDFGYNVRVSESKFALRIDRSSGIDNVVYTANGLVPPTVNDTAGAFSKNTAYKVEAYFGWERVPDEVELAAIELIKDYFSRDKIWRNKFLHSVQSFDWHFEYNTGAFIGTGNLYVDQLLLPYVITQMVLI